MRRYNAEWIRGMYGVTAEELKPLIHFDEEHCPNIFQQEAEFPVGKCKKLNIKTGMYESIPRKQEEQEMLEGNYKVALCKFLDTSKSVPADQTEWDKLVTGQPSGKHYAYAAFPEDGINLYDYALVIANGELKIVAVDELIDKTEWDGADVTKELICRVDPNPYKGRKECRKQAKKLKSQMDKIVKESQSVLIYETLAKNNPELAAMLDQYKTLTGIGESHV